MLVISPGHWLPGTGARGLIDEVTEDSVAAMTKKIFTDEYAIAYISPVENLTK